MGLHGRTVLITRAASQSEELRQGLERLGATVRECPAIEIAPVEDWTDVDRAISNLNAYDWLILTSTNAVEYFMNRVAAHGVTCNVPIAVVGAATGAKLSHWNLTPARVPVDFRAEGMLDLFPTNLKGVHILFPRAEKGREILPEELRRRGATVDVIPVYRTVKSSAGLEELRDILNREHIDAIVFTSPSAIRFLAETLGDDFSSLLASVPVAVLGPVAEEEAARVGLKPAIRPNRATIPDLIEAIGAYFSNPGQNT